MKVLVIDDDTVLLEIVGEALRKYGHEAHCAHGAREALDILKSGNARYDFILLDYKMPDDDGEWFMENAELDSGTKVLLVTAYATRDMINRMFDLGVSGYLIKPFDETELLRHLEYHMPL